MGPNGTLIVHRDFVAGEFLTNRISGGEMTVKGQIVVSRYPVVQLGNGGSVTVGQYGHFKDLDGVKRSGVFSAIGNDVLQYTDNDGKGFTVTAEQARTF